MYELMVVTYELKSTKLVCHNKRQAKGIINDAKKHETTASILVDFNGETVLYVGRVSVTAPFLTGINTKALV